MWVCACYTLSIVSIQDLFPAAERVPGMEFVIVFFFYLAIITAVIIVERFIRLHVFVHIPYRAVRYAVTKICMAIVYLALLFWFAQEILSQYPGILAALALVGAALIVCLQDVIKGFVGWLTQSQFLGLGQRVTIGMDSNPITGDVVDVGILYTSLLIARTPELKNVSQVGKIVRIPNAYLLAHPLINYNSTSDFLRVEIPVTIRDQKHYETARLIFEHIVEEFTKLYFDAARKQTERRARRFFYPPEFNASTVFSEIKSDGVSFTLCFLVPIRRKRLIVTEITQAIVTRCAEAGMEIVVGGGSSINV